MALKVTILLGLSIAVAVAQTVDDAVGNSTVGLTVPTNTGSTTAPTRTTTASSTETTLRPPANGDPCQFDDLRPHPTDCTKYLQCAGGYLWILSCPARLFFNIELQQCDYPANVPRCNKEQTTTRRNPKTTSSGSSTTPYPTSSGTIAVRAKDADEAGTLEALSEETLAKTPRPPANGDRCHFSDLRPHPTDCTKFLQCGAGYLWIMPCPADLFFNVRKQYCDYPANVPRCKQEQTTVAASSRPPANGDRCNFSDLRPHPKDCTKYLQCGAGHLWIMPCPAGLFFNVRKQYCDHPANVPRCH